MKIRVFEVPEDQVKDFAEILEQHELENSINGVSEDDNILIEVNYETDERDAVMELMLLLDPDDEDGSEED